MTRSVPAVSVVVATINRSHLIARLISHLERQRVEFEFEVVIVDDGSSDATPEVLSRALASSQLELRVHRLEENRGPAVARNVGWRAAQAPVVAFIDDDCVPDDHWLDRITTAIDGADLAQGRTEPNPDQDPEGLFSWAPHITAEGPFYEACNIAYRRSALVEVGGFDESFSAGSLRARRTLRSGRYVPPLWGEDTDLALRVKERGGASTFVDDAVVWHDVKAGRLRDRLADMPRRRGNVLLVRRHPGIREHFDSTRFVDEAHAFVVATACAVLVGLNRRPRPAAAVVAAASAAGWAVSRGRRIPRGSRSRALPQWLISDVAEVGVLAAASIRHRALLL